VDGGCAEAAEAGVVAGVAGEAMEVDGGPVAGDAEAGGVVGAGGGGAAGGGGQQASPATVFRIRLKQSPASLRHKMRVPELCRNFRCRQLSFPSAKAGFFTLLVVLLLMTSEDFNVSCSYMLD